MKTISTGSLIIKYRDGIIYKKALLTARQISRYHTFSMSSTTVRRSVCQTGGEKRQIYPTEPRQKISQPS